MRRLRQFVRDANSPVAIVDSRGLLVAWSALFGRLCRYEPTEGMPAGTALTHRSCEVLRLVAAGMTNKEIAGHLSVSTSAVKKHLKRLFEH